MSQQPKPEHVGSQPGPAASHAQPQLHAPWRMEYLQSMGEAELRSGTPKAGSGSFLYDYWTTPQHDRAHHIIVRDGLGMILLNKFPYANGHLLVALGDPRPTLLDYDAAQRAHLWSLVDLATDLMQRALQPQGINIGINQGRAAGAGVPQHLHAHLVPRWGGDVNFMTSVGQVRVIPGSLDAMYERYLESCAATPR